MIRANTRVMPLARYTGIFPVNKPYNSHISVPNVNSAYMDREMLAVSFVRIVLTAWGKNEKVVQAAASRPIMVINCTREIFSLRD